MSIISPEAFAEWFNKKIPGTRRKITTDDVCHMTECSLIGRYNSYIRQDLEVLRGILQYEKMRENRPVKQDKEKEPHCCKIFGQPLPPNPGGKPGRLREYCYGSEPRKN